MGSHINEDGKFQSDKYPTCPAGKVPLSVKDPTAQDLLWEYAQRRRVVDAEFADDLEFALIDAGYVAPGPKHDLELSDREAEGLEMIRTGNVTSVSKAEAADRWIDRVLAVRRGEPMNNEAVFEECRTCLGWLAIEVNKKPKIIATLKRKAR